MASSQSVDDLLGQPLFMEMVKAIYEAAAGTRLRQGHELNANLALDALSFVSAMLQEADPDYADDDSLSFASARASISRPPSPVTISSAERRRLAGAASNCT